MGLFTGVAQISTQLQDVPFVDDTYTDSFVSGPIGPLSNAIVGLVLGFFPKSNLFNRLRRHFLPRRNAGATRKQPTNG